MEPSFSQGDIVIAFRVFSPRLLKRNKVVIARLYHVDTPTGLVVKRLSGIPGDHLEINPNFPHIPAQTVPPKHYFLVGDNRNGSRDSRVWGAIPQSQVVGIVIKKIGRKVLQ